MSESRRILGIKVDFLSKDAALSHIGAILQEFPLSEDPDEHKKDLNAISAKSNRIICTTNPEFILSAQKDADFAEIINNSFLSVPDGAGVLYAKAYLEFLEENFRTESGVSPGFSFKYISYLARYSLVNLRFLFSVFFKKSQLSERVSGADLIYDICSFAEEREYNIFLLGGWPTNFWGKPLKNPGFDLAQETSDSLRILYPNLKVIGATSKFNFKEADDSNTLEYIQREMLEKGVTKIDIIFVCYGHNKQERWLFRNINRIPAVLGLGLGGTFDYVSGRKKRSPDFYRRYNLEWLHRIVTQPWRVRRVFNSLITFIFTLIRNSF